jgi:tRNA(fMet)-specific endonuclease VapC
VKRAQKEIGEDALLGLMTVLPLDEPAARQAAELHDTLIQRNEDIGVKDVLIAAICLANNIPLLTTNEQHFRRVQGMTVLTPVEFLTERK